MNTDCYWGYWIFLEKFVSLLTKNGKKARVWNILFKVFIILRTKYKKNPLSIYVQILQNVAPVVIGLGNRREEAMLNNRKISVVEAEYINEAIHNSRVRMFCIDNNQRFISKPFKNTIEDYKQQQEHRKVNLWKELPIPVLVNEDLKYMMSIRIIVNAIKKYRLEYSFFNRILYEFLDILKGTGMTIKHRNILYSELSRHKEHVSFAFKSGHKRPHPIVGLWLNNRNLQRKIAAWLETREIMATGCFELTEALTEKQKRSYIRKRHSKWYEKSKPLWQVTKNKKKKIFIFLINHQKILLRVKKFIIILNLCEKNKRVFKKVGQLWHVAYVRYVIKQWINFGFLNVTVKKKRRALKQIIICIFLKNILNLLGLILNQKVTINIS